MTLDQQVELKICETISVSGIDEAIIRKCVTENTFENPIFKSNELNGRSNWNTKRTISTYLYEGKNLILPRGYMRDLLKILKDKNIIPSIIDNRISNPCQYPEKLDGIFLRPYQQRAVDAAMKFDQGSIVSPTGSGKSLLALEIIRRRQQKSLIIVHRADLAKQWRDTIKKRLGLKAGIIGGGKWNIGAQITIALIQSLSSTLAETKKLAEKFGLIMADEEHHLPCQSCFTVMSLLKAKYKYGLSATTQRSDGLEEMIYRCVGPAIATITRDEVEKLGATVPTTVRALETGFSTSPDSWHDYLTALAADSNRNIFIIELATSQTSPVLILCDRVVHAKHLSEMFSRRNFKHVLAHGQVQDREGIMKKIKTSKLTIATSSLIGEGIDVSAWGVLIMASPISSEIKLLQVIGRIVRPENGKEKALVFDLKDNCGFSGASFKRRFEIYKKHNIRVEFTNKTPNKVSQDDSWRSLKATEKQINFLRSKSCKIDLNSITRGVASDLIANGKL